MPKVEKEEVKYYVTDKVKKTGYVGNFPQCFFSVVTPIFSVKKNRYNELISVEDEGLKIFIGENQAIERDYVLSTELPADVIRQLRLAEVIK